MGFLKRLFGRNEMTVDEVTRLFELSLIEITSGKNFENICSTGDIPKNLRMAMKFHTLVLCYSYFNFLISNRGNNYTFGVVTAFESLSNSHSAFFTDIKSEIAAGSVLSQQEHKLNFDYFQSLGLTLGKQCRAVELFDVLLFVYKHRYVQAFSNGFRNVVNKNLPYQDAFLPAFNEFRAAIYQDEQSTRDEFLHLVFMKSIILRAQTTFHSLEGKLVKN